MLLIFSLFSYESPRFYISQGKIAKALDVIKDISKFHGLNKRYYHLIETEEYKEIIHMLSKGKDDLMKLMEKRKKG